MGTASNAVDACGHGESAEEPLIKKSKSTREVQAVRKYRQSFPTGHPYTPFSHRLRMAILRLEQILVFFLWLPFGSPICYDQSPFWFLTRPVVENLYDDAGRMLSDKARVRWGALHNFKCVDYFQVEYRQRDDPNNKIVTPRIDRHSRYVDIDVDPCTKYVIKVLASEDYQGRREDFKAYSLEVHHKVDYTPRFISKISIKELKIRKPGARGKRKRSKREAA